MSSLVWCISWLSPSSSMCALAWRLSEPKCCLQECQTNPTDSIAGFPGFETVFWSDICECGGVPDVTGNSTRTFRGRDEPWTPRRGCGTCRMCLCWRSWSRDNLEIFNDSWSMYVVCALDRNGWWGWPSTSCLSPPRSHSAVHPPLRRVRKDRYRIGLVGLHPDVDGCRSWTSMAIVLCWEEADVAVHFALLDRVTEELVPSTLSPSLRTRWAQCRLARLSWVKLG